MRKILTLIAVLVMANAQAAESPTILVFGDSLSAGFGIDVDQSWVALLQKRLESAGYEHRVVNASISGETTAGGAARIESAISTFAPALIILELGANDGLRGFPTTSIQANIETIARRARDSGADVVLLGIRIPTNYGARYTQAFEAVFSNVATDLEIRWIEFFMDGIALNDDLLQEDRIHPNAEAQPLLLDNAWPIIRATLDAQ
jgi:acyl-CoA thioesterase-1